MYWEWASQVYDLLSKRSHRPLKSMLNFVSFSYSRTKWTTTSPFNGATWEAFEDLPFSNIQRVVFDPSDDALMYVTTFGGSVWRGPLVPHKRPNLSDDSQDSSVIRH